MKLDKLINGKNIINTARSLVLKNGRIVTGTLIVRLGKGVAQ